MGIFDLFKPKEPVVAHRRIQNMHGHLQEAFSTVHGHFATLRQEIQQQKEWLKYLHQNHLSLNSQHSDQKELTKTELTKLNSWITFLHKANQKQEKQLSQLQKQTEDALKTHEKYLTEFSEALQKVHKKASEKPAVQVIHKEKEIDYDAIATKVAQDLQLDIHAVKANLKQELQEAFSAALEEQQSTHQDTLHEFEKKVEERLQELQQEKEEKQHVPVTPAPLALQEAAPLPHHWSSSLTNPEQKLLNLLISEADPLTYTKVSQLTGHSINTIRVNMNLLKKKGVVEESTLPSGVKLFSVTNKEKIKKMYNVQVL